jgi:hypothetical protein
VDEKLAVMEVAPLGDEREMIGHGDAVVDR